MKKKDILLEALRRIATGDGIDFAHKPTMEMQDIAREALEEVKKPPPPYRPQYKVFFYRDGDDEHYYIKEAKGLEPVDTEPAYPFGTSYESLREDWLRMGQAFLFPAPIQEQKP